MIDKNEVRELRKAGMTYAEIAEEVDCSRQRVYQICSDINTPTHRGRAIQLDSIPHKGIRAYLTEHPDISLSQFCRRCTGSSGHDTYAAFIRLLQGSNAKTTIFTIKNMIVATGMSFEELFSEKE